MIKITAVASPKEGWTATEWVTHYRERHGPLTASVRSFTNVCARYVQNYALHAPDVPDFPDRQDRYAGVSELWFADVEALRTTYVDPGYMANLRPDEQRFCAFDGMVVGIAEEVEMFAAPIDDSDDKLHIRLPRFKIFAFRGRAPGTDRTAFQEQWRTRRSAQMREFGPFRQWVRRYVQSHTIDVDAGLPGKVEHDVIDEFFFDSLTDAVAFWGAYGASELMREQDAALSDTGYLWTVFASEHEIFGPLPAA